MSAPTSFDSTGISTFLKMTPIGVIDLPEHTQSPFCGVIHPFFGKQHTEETKALMRESRKGHTPFTRKCTDEERAAMSERYRGRKLKTRTAEHAAAISAAKKGKTHKGAPQSAEARAKISAAMKARWAAQKNS